MRTMLYCWWECKLIQSSWRTVWRFLRKLGIKLPYDPIIPLLGIYPGKTITEKDICTLVFFAAHFTIARLWKQPKCPLTDKWIQKFWYICKWNIQFSSVQSLSCVQLFVTPWTTTCQASLSVTNSWSLLKLMSIELVMPSNHLILCLPLLSPSIFPSISLFK